MRILPRLAVLGLGLVVAWSGIPASAAAVKSDDWVDTQGTKFRGTPSALLGPFALFRTGATTARRLPVNFLRPEDAARFQEAVETRPPRAADWSQAKSAISSDLRGRVLRLKAGALVPDDLAGRPEPEIYVLFFVNSGVGPSWEMMGTAMEKFGEFSRNYPGLVEGVMVGVGQSRGDQVKMATGMNVPWLVTEVLDQGGMADIRRYQPAAAPFLAIVTRDGTALATSPGDKKDKVVAEMKRLGDLLELLPASNPAAWGPLQGYWRAVHQHRSGANPVPPRLVGDPLRADVLRQNGVESFTARLKLDADGKVQDVVIADGAKLPDELVNPVRLALVQAVLAPAATAGRSVPGEFTYRFPPQP